MSNAGRFWCRARLPALFLVTLCVGYWPRVSAAASNGAGCAPIDADVVAFCGKRVNYRVPADMNQTTADEMARFQHENGDGSLCPSWTSTRYVCAKYFPRCDNTTSSTVVRNLCRTECERADACRYYNMATECSQNAYYSTRNNCYAFPSTSTKQTWKFVLVGIIVGLAVLMLASYLYSRYRECTYNPDNDPHLDEVVAGEVAKVAPAPAPQMAIPTYMDINELECIPARAQGEPVTIEQRMEAWNRSVEMQRWQQEEGK